MNKLLLFLLFIPLFSNGQINTNGLGYSIKEINDKYGEAFDASLSDGYYRMLYARGNNYEAFLVKEGSNLVSSKIISFNRNGFELEKIRIWLEVDNLCILDKDDTKGCMYEKNKNLIQVIDDGFNYVCIITNIKLFYGD